MTVGKRIHLVEQPFNMAKRQKSSHEISPEKKSPEPRDTSSRPYEEEDYEQTPDTRSDPEQALRYTAGSNTPDINIIEFRRTESDDEPMDPEPVPLSDSELPPRPKIYKKKKSKKGSSKPKDSPPKDDSSEATPSQS